MKKLFVLLIITIINGIISLTVKADNSQWMRGLNDSLRFSDIVIPGSHDAGMSRTDHCTLFVKSEWDKTQQLSIADQLKAGSRYFDIRLDYDHGSLVTYHRTDGVGCNGEKLDNILSGVASFLRKNPKEVIILKFSHTRNDWMSSGGNDDIQRRAVNLLLQKYSSILYKLNNKNVNLATVTLGALRGKIVAVFDEEYSEQIAPAKGIFSYRDSYAQQDGQLKNITDGNLIVYDKYSDTTDYYDMKKDQLNKLLDFGTIRSRGPSPYAPASLRPYLFLLSWTLTGHAEKLDIRDLANEANSHLKSGLDAIFRKGYPKPNIIYIDFMSEALASQIIQYNTLFKFRKHKK